MPVALPPPRPPYGKHGRPPVRCQHCDRDIEPLADGVRWVDSDGFEVCVKNTSELPFTVNSFIVHKPMPAI